jgi:hypothetical protein
MKLTTRDVSISATVNLLEFARSLPLDWDRLEKLMPQLERMRYVEEVEDRHQFWIKLELATGNAQTAQRRIDQALIKVERLFRHYAKGATA